MEIKTFINSESKLHNLLFNEKELRVGARMAIFIALWVLLRNYIVRGLSRLIFLNLFTPGSVKFGADQPLRPGVTFVFPFLEFAVLLFACWIMSKIERRNMGNYGLPLKSIAIFELLTGTIMSFVALSVLVFIIYLFHGITFTGYETHGVEVLMYGFYWAITFLMVGFSEEYTFRGYALTTITEAINFWPSAILLSLIFTVFHIGNSGETKLGLFSVMVAGLVFAYFVKVTGNLWYAVGFHAGWDWAQSFFYGVPDSGQLSVGRWLISVAHGPTWLTGGTAGPEGSVFCPLVMLFVAWLIGRFYPRKTQSVGKC
jgi:membrane protease YdiL (CAAX protease family)